MTKRHERGAWVTDSERAMSEVLWGVVVPNCWLCDDPESLARVGEAFPCLRESVSCRLVSSLGRHQAVTSACSAGALNLCRGLCRDLTRADFDEEWLVAASRGEGGVAMLEWLSDHFQVVKADVENPQGSWKTLNAACSRGHEQEAKWIVQRFGIVAGELEGCSLLMSALLGGHGRTARWLLSTGLVGPPEDIARQCRPLWWLVVFARTGSVDVMETVLETFLMLDDLVARPEASLESLEPPQRREFPAIIEALLCCLWDACLRGGSLSLMQWAKERLPLDHEMMAAYFDDCVGSGNVKAMEWFADSFKIVADGLCSLKKRHAMTLFPESEDEEDGDRVEEPDEGISLPKLLSSNCGQLETLKWLVKWGGVEKSLVLESELVRVACSVDAGGPAARWLVEHFSLDAVEARCTQECSVLLCRGDFETCEWLARRFSCDLPELLGRAPTKIAASLLLRNDLQALGKLLRSECFPTNTLATRFVVALFSMVCCSGDVELARWMFTSWNLSKESLHLDKEKSVAANWDILPESVSSRVQKELDVSGTSQLLLQEVEDCNVLKTVCRRGSLAMAQWLAASFALTKGDVLDLGHCGPCDDCCSVIAAACHSGNLELVKWLVSHLSLTTSDLHFGRAMRSAMMSRSCSLVSWLTTSFDFTRDDSFGILYSFCRVRLSPDILCVLPPTRLSAESKRHVVPPVGRVRVSYRVMAVSELVWGVVVPNSWICDDCQSLARIGEAFESLRASAASRLVCCLGRHEAVKASCSAGAVQLCKLLCRDLTRRNFGVDWMISAVQGSSAMSGGGVPLLEWLTNHFAVQKADIVDVRRTSCLPMREACTQGREEEARWLFFRFGLTGDDVSHGDCFLSALSGGHVRIARWLLSVGLVEVASEIESHVKDVQWLGSLVSRGAVEVLELLLDSTTAPKVRNTVQGVPTPGTVLEPLDSGNTGEELLRCVWCACCSSGFLNLMCWAKERLGLSVQVMAMGFTDCVRSGSSDAIKWFTDAFGTAVPSLLPPVVAECYDKALSELLAPKRGRLQVVQWLVTTGRLDKKAILQSDVVIRVSEVAGGGPAVRWLVEHFSLSNLDTWRVLRDAICELAGHGDFETTEWLARRFSVNLPRFMLRRGNEIVLQLLIHDDLVALTVLLASEYFPKSLLEGKLAEALFTVACCSGEVAFVEQISPCCSLSKDSLQIKADNCYAPDIGIVRRCACDADNSSIAVDEIPQVLATWLEDCNILRTVCLRGHLEMVRWLVRAFSLSKEDILASTDCLLPTSYRECNNALSAACRSGNLLLVQWLVSTFSLTSSDLRTVRALCAAVASESFPLVSWLSSSFVFTRDDTSDAIGDTFIGLSLDVLSAVQPP